MSGLVKPHGGRLNPRLVGPSRLDDLRRQAAGLVRISLDSREVSDVVMLASGAFSPLDGFMTKADYLGVVESMHLAGGLLWPIPVTLAVSREQAAGLKEGSRIALHDPESDQVVGILDLQEKYAYDKQKECLGVFGTDDRKHPGVAKILAQDEVYLGGPVEALGEGEYPAKYDAYARPAETRKIFESRGWSSIAAFQTRNPIHRSHEYLTKIALEMCDGLFIHPVVGKLKEGDIPADVRMDCYNVLLDRYYPAGRVVMKVYPMEMRYAGPREALLHAIIRQNFGCSHLIVGRDHAGVGKYYGPFDAQKIFDTLVPGELEIRPMKMDWTFWCRRCDAIVSTRTCPHPDADRLMISGTQLRDMLAAGVRPPAQFGRPEVMDILIDFYARDRATAERVDWTLDFQI